MLRARNFSNSSTWNRKSGSGPFNSSGSARASSLRFELDEVPADEVVQPHVAVIEDGGQGHLVFELADQNVVAVQVAVRAAPEEQGARLGTLLHAAQIIDRVDQVVFLIGKQSQNLAARTQAIELGDAARCHAIFPGLEPGLKLLPRVELAQVRARIRLDPRAIIEIGTEAFVEAADQQRERRFGGRAPDAAVEHRFLQRQDLSQADDVVAVLVQDREQLAALIARSRAQSHQDAVVRHAHRTASLPGVQLGSEDVRSQYHGPVWLLPVPGNLDDMRRGAGS